jgi:stage II sporulation protein D
MIISAGAIIISVVASAEDAAPELVQALENEDIGGDTISADVPVTENDFVYSEFLPHIDMCQTPIRVGVFYIYGSNNCLAFSHNIYSENGLMFYSKTGEEYAFFRTSDKPVTIMRDFSAAKNSSGKYYFTTDGNTHIIYHAITSSPVTSEALDDTISNYKTLLPEGTAVFPFYISGKPHIAVGTYADKDASAADCQNLTALLGVEFIARTPNNTCISIVETDSGKILFKIDTADCKLFVRPLRAEGQTNDPYIKSSVGNIFDGTFEYKATIDGLYLVNILELDDYIKSVLPYEISASWPVETLKAFSIIVRSYTLSNIFNNHKNQDFDMCDETHCQAYRGRLRSTPTTDAAVDATANMVLAYDSKICKTFYHAISGGMTEASENVWYTAYEYLRPMPVPDEKYQNYTYGEWSTTVSKEELYTFLQNNSTVSKKISAPITDVRISEYTPSGYAYKLEITDSDGNVAVFEKTDNIRTILSKYCKSARMSIGKTMEVSINEAVSELDAISFFQTSPDGTPIRFNATANSTQPEYKTVLTANGEFQLVPSTEMITISGTGWGHGVGLSQYGARDMALNGYNWIEIATYFFPGSYLAYLSDLSTPLFTDTDEETEPDENAKPPNDEPSDVSDNNELNDQQQLV